MKRVFLDTAIFAQTWDQRAAEAHKREAALELLERDDVELVTSSVVLGQLFSAIWKANKGESEKVRHKRAREAVSTAVPLAGLSVGAREILAAMELSARHRFQFWDAVNWSTARLGGCEWHASFDRPGNPQAFSGVTFFDPMDPPI